MKIGHDLKGWAFLALAALCAPFGVSAHAEASIQPTTQAQLIREDRPIAILSSAGGAIFEATTIDREIRNAEFPYFTANKLTEYELIAQDTASEEYNRERAIKDIGSEQHDINQNLQAVVLACMKKFGPGEACEKASAESWDEFYDCTTTSSDRVGCAKSVADHMVPIYAAP